MKLKSGIRFHKSQLAMELDISQPEDRKIADKILQKSTVISIQHFIAEVKSKEAAVIIGDGKDIVHSVLGDWEFNHSVQDKVSFTNYFRFVPKYDVYAFFLETIDPDTDEQYLYYTFTNYKKL